MKHNEESRKADISEFRQIMDSSSYDINFMKVEQDVEKYFEEKM